MDTSFIPMPENVEHVVAQVGAVLILITPAARALMFVAKQCRKLAALTQNKTDDAIAARCVYAMESVCGTLAKIMMHLPRLTVGR
jgi:hypothetical protein